MNGHNRQANAGVTLIELVVVIAIIAIISSIALPSYAKYVQKSKRVKAQSCLLEYSQYMERFRSANMRYDKKLDGSSHTLPSLDCASDGGLDESYTIGLLANSLKSREYTLQAIPKGGQSVDSCGTMAINHMAVKAAAESNCW